MARYVPDIKTKRWVIISPGRVGRPADMGHKKSTCVFCPGNEGRTPPEVLRFGKGDPNKKGWQVRVIPNKYPITDFHEVVIHSPDESKDIERLSPSEVGLIFKAYHKRFNYYREKGRVLIFCNHGFNAGASLRHPHSQLVVVPFQINLDTLERQPVANIVIDNKYFIAYCPEFSQWPYEVWISPKGRRQAGGPSGPQDFGEIGEEELSDLAAATRTVIRRLVKLFPREEGHAYNYYIHHGKDWYLRIMPRLVHRAGFELGTGLSVNVIDPSDAAEKLRE